jgi:hypothetical protein
MAGVRYTGPPHASPPGCSCNCVRNHVIAAPGAQAGKDWRDRVCLSSQTGETGAAAAHAAHQSTSPEAPHWAFAARSLSALACNPNQEPTP